VSDSASQWIALAAQAAMHAYIPYSHYAVGAALVTASGSVYTGCNVENASFPAGICAERVALVKAISEGVRQFSAIAVVTRNGGSPCGICRQMLYEFAPDLRVIMADEHGAITFDGKLHTLLPFGFGASSLTDTHPPLESTES
jgi:cytidine deaminase